MEPQELILAHRELRGYRLGSGHWIFAPYHFRPSYWLILKREGFSGDLFTASSELNFLTSQLSREAIENIFQIVSATPPVSYFDFRLRNSLESLVLSGQIKVFEVDSKLALRMQNVDDPIYYNYQDQASSGSQQSHIRNNLAEELAVDIISRWVGKDKADRLHWNRSLISRELVEAYDVAAEAVDTVADLVVGLWDIVKFTVRLAGDGLELAFDISSAVKKFRQKVETGDIEGIRQDLEALGIEVADAMESAEKLIAKAREGYTIFQQLMNDPTTKRLIIDYLESLWDTIPYRNSRTIGVRIFAEIGVEVLLALATGGAGNVARRAAQTGVRGTKIVKASRIGPFTAKAIDLMVDLAQELRKVQKTRKTGNKKWLNGEVGVESLPPLPRPVATQPPAPKNIAKKQAPRAKNKPRQPSKNNPHIDHSKTTKNASGSTTYYDNKGNKVTYDIDGYPDFSEHSEIDFTVDNMDGTNKDFSKVYKKMKEEYGFETQKEAKEWLSKEGLTPHHHTDGKTIQLVDKAIHDRFQHTGGASILRGK